MSLIYNGTVIPSSYTINYNGTSLSQVVIDGITVWKKQVSGFTNFSFTKTGDSVWDGNSGHHYTSSHSCTVSGRRLQVDFQYVSQLGGTLSARSGVMDLSGYNTATIYYSLDGQSATFAFGSVSKSVSGGSSVSLDISSLTSAALSVSLTVFDNRSSMANSESFHLQVNSITFS